jgi:hypothetical protein
VPIVGILGAGRLGRALANRISPRLRTAISDCDSGAAVSGLPFHDPPGLAERCDVILVCVPPSQVAAAIASCSHPGPVYLNMATSVRTSALASDPRLGGLTIAGFKPICQYLAIGSGAPTVFVTSAAAKLQLLREVAGDLGPVTLVSEIAEDAVGAVNRIATLAALRACTALDAELRDGTDPGVAALAGTPGVVAAAISNVLAGTALDYPPDPANPYIAALLQTLNDGVLAHSINAAAALASGVDVNGQRCAEP